MFVELNGKKLEITEDTKTLRDIFDVTKTQYSEGLVVGVVKGRKTQKLEIFKEYAIHTTKGEIKIEINDENKRLWFKNYEKFIGSKVHWSQPQVTSIGPVVTDLNTDRSEREYQRWDVIYSLGGFDSVNTYLSFIKRRHVTSYGTNAIIGKTTAGKSVLEKLENGDIIQKIEPIERWELVTDKFTTFDLDTKLEDGMEVYTYVKAVLSRDASEGVEHFLALVKNGYFRVDATTNSYIMSSRLKGRSCPFEVRDVRGEGAITIRTAGSSFGNVYIYKKDASSSPNHSVIGYISEGLEFIKLAAVGQQLKVETDPVRIMFLGKTYSAIEQELEKFGLELKKEGYTGDDAVIVSQTPLNTVDILKSKRIQTFAIPEKGLVEVNLYESTAPKTISYFRMVTGLRDNPVGSLRAYVTYGRTIIFRSQTKDRYELVPENIPTEIVKDGEIGVTNQAAKHAGLIGVRLEDNSRYGPTGEKFSGTNIIGKIVEPKALKEVKENDMIYLYEAL